MFGANHLLNANLPSWTSSILIGGVRYSRDLPFTGEMGAKVGEGALECLI